jgi:hypothetical protein
MATVPLSITVRLINFNGLPSIFKPRQLHKPEHSGYFSKTIILNIKIIQTNPHVDIIGNISQLIITNIQNLQKRQ